MEVWNKIVLLFCLSAFFSVMYALGRNELVKRRLTCPRTGQMALVDVVQRYGKRHRPVRVASCDQLPDRRRVDCDQGCLRRRRNGKCGTD